MLCAVAESQLHCCQARLLPAPALMRAESVGSPLDVHRPAQAQSISLSIYARRLFRSLAREIKLQIYFL